MWVVALILLSVVALFSIYIYALVKLFRKKLFIALIALAIIPFAAYEAFQYYWYSAVLPEKIEITYPVSIGDESGFREGCGVAVFKLSKNTTKNIEKGGLAFFSGATQARGHNDNYHKYEPWKETPVPVNWASEGSWFMCSVISNNLERKIIMAAQEKGAYYTTKPEGVLIVIPSLGYVVFSYNG